MSNKLCLVLSVLLPGTMLLAACAPAAPTAAQVQPTTAPATTAAPLPNGSSIKVGLVTDTGGVNDQAFNQLAWEGVQKAATDMGFQAKFLESSQPTDYETNIDALAAEGYNVIITVGAPMGDATALKAKQYPDIKFAIIDNAYAISGINHALRAVIIEEIITAAPQDVQRISIRGMTGQVIGNLLAHVVDGDGEITAAKGRRVIDDRAILRPVFGGSATKCVIGSSIETVLRDG